LLVALCIVAVIVSDEYAPRVGAWVTVAGIFAAARATVLLRRRGR
jgi:hypothetical protein